MAKGKSNTLLAFLAGGLAGAAIALLWAPAEGAQTRKKIREGMDEAGDWTMDKFEDAKESLDSGAEKIRDIMENKKGDLRSAFDVGRDAFQRRRESFLKKKQS